MTAGSERTDRLAEHWRLLKPAYIEARQPLWKRQLNRSQIVEAGSPFFTGRVLFRESIELLLMEEGGLASELLDAAEYYLALAQERDELSTYGRIGQETLGRSERVKTLVLIRWVREGHLDLVSFNAAVLLKTRWLEEMFALPQWREGGWSLAEWMAELLLLGESARAIEVYGKYGDRGAGGHGSLGYQAEQAFYVVAECLQGQTASQCPIAEAALDRFYQKVTDWDKDDLEMLADEKLICALIRGKYFKNEQDPMKLIAMMRTGA